MGIFAYIIISHISNTRTSPEFSHNAPSFLWEIVRDFVATKYRKQSARIIAALNG